jgi:nuclear transport factor 2 (NTF2) superfamily protein
MGDNMSVDAVPVPDRTGPARPGITDPVAYLSAIEDAWRRRDGAAASAGYTDDAVLIFGNAQQRSGAELRRWPQQWFDFARDLRITKTYRAFSGDCLASEWESEYTHPRTGKMIKERGAEFFFLRDGKVYRHHMFEHTWPAGQHATPWPAI